MGDSGIATAQVGAFNVTTNSGVSSADLAASLKPKADKAASEAASQLGKRGAEAAAKARAEREEAEPAAEERAEEKPEKKPIKPIPPKAEGPAEPEKKEPEEPAGEEKAEAKEPEPEEETEDKKRDRKDPYRRLLDATRKEAEAKTELARERHRNEMLEARLAALERNVRPEPTPQPAQHHRADQKPTPENFNTYEEYLDARDTYNREQWEADITKRYQTARADHALNQSIQRFSEATRPHLENLSAEVRELQTEFQLHATNPNATPNGSNWVANELVFNPEAAAGLMLYLSSHPDELRRIAALRTPREVSREMAKLETRLEAATTGDGSKREEQVSKAAPPVKPVTGKPYVTESDEYRPGMSLDEYHKVWKKARK